MQILEICSHPILKCEKEDRTTHIYRTVNKIITREGKLNDEEVCLTQISVTKDIGDRAFQTVLKEFSQLDNEGVVDFLIPENFITRKEGHFEGHMFS